MRWLLFIVRSGEVLRRNIARSQTTSPGDQSAADLVDDGDDIPAIEPRNRPACQLEIIISGAIYDQTRHDVSIHSSSEKRSNPETLTQVYPAVRLVDTSCGAPGTGSSRWRSFFFWKLVSRSIGSGSTNIVLRSLLVSATVCRNRICMAMG